MKIAFLCQFQNLDVRASSGIPYFIVRELERQGEQVQVICPSAVWQNTAYRCLQSVSARLHGQNRLWTWDPLVVKALARGLDAQLRQSDADLVLTYHPPTLAYLKCDKPIAVWHDSTFEGWIRTYGTASAIRPRSVARARQLDHRAFERAGLAIFSSEWAAKTANDFYRLDPVRVRTVPFGANLDCVPSSAEVHEAIESRSNDVCRLLFVAVEWQRKGGPLALEVARLLNKRGIATELTVLGRAPDMPSEVPSFVNAVGFVDKRTTFGMAQLGELYTSAHLLLMPSRVEAFGIAFCEASAFGVPVVTTDVGGITTVVRDGINGMTFPAEAGPEPYCEYIVALMRDRGRYQVLARSARAEYERRLNWAVACGAVRVMLRELLEVSSRK